MITIIKRGKSGSNRNGGTNNEQYVRVAVAAKKFGVFFSISIYINNMVLEVNDRSFFFHKMYKWKQIYIFFLSFFGWVEKRKRIQQAKMRLFFVQVFPFQIAIFQKKTHFLFAHQTNRMDGFATLQFVFNIFNVPFIILSSYHRLWRCFAHSFPC